MSPKKTTGIVCAILLLSTIMIVGLLYRSNVNESSDLLAEYNKNTQHFDRTQSSTIIEEIKNDSGEDSNDFTPTIPGVDDEPVVPGTPTSTDFVQALSVVHKLFGHSGLKYSLGGSGTLVNGDGVRTDCSGYISYALYYQGVFSKGQRYDSASMPNAPGLDNVTSSINSPSDLLPGDILVYNNHVEAYAGNGRVYNWGGHASAEDKYSACSGHDHKTCTADSTSNWYRDFSSIVAVMRVK